MTMSMPNFVSMFVASCLRQYVHPIVNSNTYHIEFVEVLSRAKINGDIYKPYQFMKHITPDLRYEMAVGVLNSIIRFQKIYPDVKFSINLSCIEIDQGFDKFLDSLATVDLDPKRTILEIVETALVHEKTILKLEQLKNKHGFLIALDDFGTGYSNIDQINQSHALFDYIKVDGSLVVDIETNEKKFFTLINVLNIIKVYEKHSVVEYVSNEECLKKIQLTGAHFIQGFLFGEPIPIETFFESNQLEAPLPFCPLRHTQNYTR